MTTNDQGEPILLERRESTLVITLNRPKVRNAVDASLANSLSRALDQLDTDQGLRVGVITGAGDCFSSGLDLKAFLDGESADVSDRGFAGISRRAAKKPLIAAIEGYALAGGFEIALACDLIVASRNAQFGLPEVCRGLVAAGGALLRLPRRIPYHAAMEMVLTGEPTSASRLYELGLVNRLAEPGSALSVAEDLSQEIARNAPNAVLTSKDVLQRAGDLTMADGWDYQNQLLESIINSEEALEGVAAFKERRKPVWT